jgi:glycosyltransferase involved in cell wall biosynthesis
VRLGFDGSTLTSTRTGVGRYAACLLDALLARPDVREIHVFAPRAPELTGIPAHPKLALHARNHWPRLAWLLFWLPREAVPLRLDAILFPNYFSPPDCPAPRVVTVHDMTVFDCPAVHPWRRRLAHRLLLRRSLDGAAAVLVPSETSRRDLLRWFPRLAERVRVVPEAPAPSFRRIEAPSELDRIRRAYALPPRFVLSPSGAEPRKNLGVLIRAMEAVRETAGDVSLVITGPARSLPLRPWLRDVGYVAEADMPALYTLAEAVAYPSLYEGFGLPPLEAMACGTPVVASAAGAIPEVCGDAALLVGVLDAPALADALRRILTDGGLRRGLIERGRARAAAYAWARTAALTLDALRHVAAHPVG